MNDFDELLNDVLRQDANPQIPSGMKERIIACLLVEDKHSQNRKVIWAGIAAALVAGLMTWTFTRTRIASPGRAPSAVISQARPNNSIVMSARRESELPEFYQQPAARKPMQRARIAALPRALSQQRAIQVAPLEIKPIVIQPIEIASLSPNGSTRRGNIR